ncbi:MAG: metallophosphoesterase [Actinomycetes bacterium]
MRILLVSDLHDALPQFDWVVEAAGDSDLVVLAGDHLDIASHVALGTQSFVIGNDVTLLREKAQVIISSGNHDLTGPDEHGENAALWIDGVRADGVWTDGDSVELDDTLVTVCPWWDGPIGRERVAAHLARDAARRPARWIWGSHWPPVDSTTSWTGSRHYGDPDLAGWIAEFAPYMVLAGHVHGPPFKPDGSWVDRIGTTWVFNPGNQRGPVPTFVDIDLDANEATWVSQMGIERADLTAATAPARTLF